MRLHALLATLAVLAGAIFPLAHEADAAKLVRATRPPQGASGYDLAARIAEIRAHPDYGSAFSDTSDPYTPSGLQLPTAPSGMTACPASDIATVNSCAAAGNRDITLQGPGTYTGTITISGQNVRLTMTAVTVNSASASAKCLVTTYTARYVEVIGGHCGNSAATVRGKDIRIRGTNFTGSMDPSSDQSNGTEFRGERLVVEGATVRNMPAGFFFIGAGYDGEFSGYIDGTTLHVTSMDGGVIRVGDSLERRFGSPGPTVPTRITALGTGTGGVGTYTVSVSQALGSFESTVPLRAIYRSSNVILANSDVEVPLKPSGAVYNEENTSRFNGVHMGVVMDSRLYSELKHTLRAHAAYANERWSSGTIGWFNVQSERIGAYSEEPGPTDVNPAVENLYIDGWRLYRSTAHVTGGLLAMPAISEISLPPTITYTANGTTVTVAVPANYEHGIQTGDPINVSNVSVQPSLNATGVSATRIDSLTFSYPNTTSAGTYTCTQPSCSSRIQRPTRAVVQHFWMKNSTSYSAPPGGGEGTAGAGLMPSGLGTPAAGWTTVTNASTSLANGNSYQSYTAPPTWTKQ